jgi:hypothetical protein
MAPAPAAERNPAADVKIIAQKGAAYPAASNIAAIPTKTFSAAMAGFITVT